MAYTAWQPLSLYSIGDIVAPTELLPTGLVFRCITSGTTASGEPQWPAESYKTATISGVTSASIGFVDDGTVRWAAISAVHADLQPIYPSSIIELFELELNTQQHGSSEILRFHAGTSLNLNTDLVWQGLSYRALPIEADGFEYNGGGQLPRPKLRVSNLYLIISTALAELPHGLEGAKVTRIRTLARYLDDANFPADSFILQEDGGIFLMEDGSKISTEEGQINPFGQADPSAEFPREIYLIDRKSAENRDIVEFELASAFDLQNMRLPRRQTIANICQWKYRQYDATTASFDYAGVTCPYAEALYYNIDNEATANPAEDICNKRLDGCRTRFAPVTITASPVTTGSTTVSGLTTEEASSVLAGMPISGFGVPAGTTIAATTPAAGTITLSASITKNGRATASGTLSANGLQLNITPIASSLLVFPGMTISGSNVPADTTVTAINQTTGVATLSSAFNTEGFTTIATLSALYSAYDENYALLTVASTTGLQAGDTVTNDAGQFYKDTTIISVASATEVVISRYQALDLDTTVTAQFKRRITYSLSLYTFTASPVYTARKDGALPYGGFPSVGSYRI
jgi:phage-related protein